MRIAPKILGSRCSLQLRGQEGQSLIEMAVVLPTFFLLLFGLFQFSIILFGLGNATFAARAAARYASVNSASSPSPCTNASIKAIAMQYLPLAPANTVTVTPSWPSGGTNVIGSSVKVVVQIVYPFNIPFAPQKQLTVQSTAQRTVVN